MAPRLLKPLGDPPPNSVKFFAAREVWEQTQDRAWPARVTSALNQHWQEKTSAKRAGVEREPHPAPLSVMADG